ncbi:MAG: 2-oxo acid dehydrogenase subunit E2 [Planctomycetota bacterium]|jgi:pyruvate dehydrogenase E2 component (dihydrolipoamide acetyltransferase)
MSQLTHGILLKNENRSHPANPEAKAKRHYIPLTRIQKLICRRMLESKRTKPCFYLEAKADITELMAMRPKLRKAFGVRITTNAFYIHALALAAQEYPLTVGRLDGDHIRIAERLNVGFAVNAPQGLVVPVVKDADEKSLPEIAREEKLLTDKARDNKLTLVEIEGETIALSNLGAYGTDSFIGIVPPPTSTIVAVGNVIHTVVPMNDEMPERKIVSLTVAADRRVVDEIYAARFLGFIRDHLQNPQELI